MIWEGFGIAEDRLDTGFLRERLSATAGTRRTERAAETSWKIEDSSPKTPAGGAPMRLTAVTFGSPTNTRSFFLMPCSSWAVRICPLWRTS